MVVIQGSGSPAGSKRSMCRINALSSASASRSASDATHTGVNAVAPTEVAAQVAPDVEPVRRRPFAWIAVGCGEHEAAALSFWNHVALDLDVSRRDASRHA